MKIIDLLVNLNNFNKCELDNMPGIIKYNNKIFYFNSKDVKGYYTEKPGKGGESLFKEINHLNDTIEILEEEKKIPEKLDVFVEVMSSDKIGALIKEIGVIKRKFNQLIEYLKSKGDE